VLATKVGYPVKTDPYSSKGLAKEHIQYEVDQSLKRLGTDYIDLYIPHFWDYETPIEETMEALHEIVKTGKVRYLGASKMYAWQFQKAQYVAEKNNWTMFISMQNHMNLIYREDERELLPLCKDQGVVLTPFSPLAAGRLTRPLEEVAATKRGQTDNSAKKKYGYAVENDRKIIQRLKEIADKRKVSMAQLALAWLKQKPQVSSPIVGGTKNDQLEDTAIAMSIQLTEKEIEYLEETYYPHPVVGAK
jgi:aryl-alcohol dehydrogenase-like predicted oxidoreductase